MLTSALWEQLDAIKFATTPLDRMCARAKMATFWTVISYLVSVRKRHHYSYKVDVLMISLMHNMMQTRIL